MNKGLTRYQIYLDPDDVFAVGRIARRIKVSRSQIIREATKAVALRYVQVAKFISATEKNGANPLKDLIGLEKSRTGAVGLQVDEIYRQ
jgi:predicted transcriptional regulator